jgi:hypothetical protein
VQTFEKWHTLLMVWGLGRVILMDENNLDYIISIYCSWLDKRIPCSHTDASNYVIGAMLAQKPDNTID